MTTTISNANPNLFIAQLLTDPDGLIFTDIIGWVLETDKTNGGYHFAYPITPEEVYWQDSDPYVIMNRKYGEWFEPFANSGKGERDLLTYLLQRKKDAEEQTKRIAAHNIATQKKAETK
jgi:hypothetical protein